LNYIRGFRIMAYNKPNIASVHFPDFVEAMPDLTGKSFVVSGTTSGTGRVAVKTLAQKGGRVIMLNRASSRSVIVQDQMSQAYPDGRVTTIECDLQSFASVRAAGKRLHEVCADEGIYALINNAGIMAMPDEATADGFDTQMQTNHLSHFLLTREVFGLLQKGATLHGESRIVNHSSMSRKGVKKLEAKYLEANGGDLGGNGSSMFFGGARWVRYSQTKLANAAFTAALHHRLRQGDSKVKALLAHPGWANTELQVTTNKAGGIASSNSILARFLSQSEEDGALGILSCAVLPEAVCGEFYGPGLGMMASKGSAKAYQLEAQYDNPETRELLWEKSCEAVGVSFSV
jgi:NAD(P)-dependent dehydrogenase (short-subunit alcohol dehydrogenase family)